ncbi:bifunctional UDP-N-acetylglucosamine diphosphorylase/glucosamine-1-phosphate N-acetyltransferase GlmU [Jannaschia sp. R86511]|uniref:bifunctional UDP-N-acetylglucosamine diphosphorylase/glucosamine-1-phosphate N-acetyltransferase GlmU n=1 Tax=Jannaschia sp. R86511 TaxID=3093853 RepID=UPI0036D3E710
MPDATTDAPCEAVVVLAAGQGTRMRSATPKVLHRIGGRSLLGHALAAAAPLAAGATVVVVRHDRDQVAEHAAQVLPEVVVADQDEVPGTGRALWCGLQALDAARAAAGLPELDGRVLVTYGDVPLITRRTLAGLLAADPGAAVSVLTAVLDDATGYGRVLRDASGEVSGIVEHKDADEAQRAVREINTGVYALDLALCRQVLPDLRAANAQGEQYLTDVIAHARERGLRVVAVAADDPTEVDGVNDRVQLAAAGARLNARVLEAHMRAGVGVVDPATTWVDVDVELAQDVTLLPGTQLHDGTVVAAGAVVGPDTTLTRCRVGAGAQVVRTHGSDAVVGPAATVGPFAYLRPGTDLGERGKIGTFVETKNATIGAGSKVPHLSYVGDATIGVGSNIGAACVFVNYDGVTKSASVIGDHVRIGSDNMLIAPLVVGDGAYTAAGAVLRKDVPPGALAMSVAPQRITEGWVASKRAGTPSAEAAARAGAPDPHDGTTPTDSQGATR